MNNTTTLNQFVKDLYTRNPQISIKDILAVVHDTNSPEAASLNKDKVYYQTVRNALLKASGRTPTSRKPQKTSKASVILDLTADPINKSAVKGKVYFKGRA
jgi:hypothetical protein